MIQLDALQSLRTALRLSVECGCPFYEILCRVALAPVSAACGDVARAGVELRRVRRLQLVSLTMIPMRKDKAGAPVQPATRA